jgi:plasmid stability protein
MNATIRNIDETLCRSLKARAASEGRAMGEALNDAIR